MVVINIAITVSFKVKEIVNGSKKLNNLVNAVMFSNSRPNRYESWKILRTRRMKPTEREILLSDDSSKGCMAKEQSCQKSCRGI